MPKHGLRKNDSCNDGDDSRFQYGKKEVGDNNSCALKCPMLLQHAGEGPKQNL